MALVPTLPAIRPPPEPPLLFEAPLSYDDRFASVLRVQKPRLDRQRRRSLTVVLPVLCLLVVLGSVSAWATSDRRNGFADFFREVGSFDWLPLLAGLAVVVVMCVGAWLLHPVLIRQQLRAALGPRGADGPVTVRYRLDEEGITWDGADLKSFTPWSFLSGLDEDRERIFVLTNVPDNPFVLRKAALGAEVLEAIRLRVTEAAGRPDAAGGEAVPQAAPDAVRLSYTLSEKERAALILYTMNTRSMRLSRLRSALFWIAGLSLLYPLLLAVLWAMDPYRVPFEAALPLYLEMIRADAWQPTIGATALVGLMLAINPLLRRFAARDPARQATAAARPGDYHVAFDADGLASSHGRAQARFHWEAFRGRARAGDLILLKLPWGSVVPVPARAFASGDLPRFEALLARHLPLRSRR